MLDFHEEVCNCAIIFSKPEFQASGHRGGTLSTGNDQLSQLCTHLPTNEGVCSAKRTRKARFHPHTHHHVHLLSLFCLLFRFLGRRVKQKGRWSRRGFQAFLFNSVIRGARATILDWSLGSSITLISAFLQNYNVT